MKYKGYINILSISSKSKMMLMKK